MLTKSLRKLTSIERGFVDAIFDTIFPGPERSVLPHGVRDMDPAGFMADTLAVVPFESVVGARIALWMIALAPLFTIARFATIASLSPADRQRVLEKLIASPIYAVRQLTLVLKALAALLYAQSPSVRARMLATDAESSELVSLRVSPSSGARVAGTAEKPTQEGESDDRTSAA